MVGAASVVLLASMFVLDWYGLTGGSQPTAGALGVHTSVNGWDGLTTIRWLMLLTALVGLALAYLQAARRAPALPVTTSVIVTVLGIVTVLALLYRVLINAPGPDSAVTVKAGAYVGLISAVAIVAGGYASMRHEGIAEKDGPGPIETVSLGRAAETAEARPSGRDVAGES
jgi:hypothetical protein